MSDQRHFHMQLFVTSVAATVLGFLPPIRTYQLHRSKAYEAMSASERSTMTVILVGVTLMHVGEAFKSVAFTMLFYSTEKLLSVLTVSLVDSVALLIVEIARLLCIHAILTRTADFLVRPIDPPAVRARSVLWVHILNGARIVWPIAVAFFVAPSLYGAYAVLMLAADVVVCLAASIAVYLRVNERRRKELLPAISTLVLYSNALVTLLIALLAFMLMAIMGSGVAGNFGTSDSSQAFIESLPSVYATFVGILLCFAYWDVKEILSANSPTGTSPRRGTSTGLGRNVFTF
ncbi:hypothetical protein HK105_209212 [Polyrhizophydium stewartii]|uniref:Uncharacterized protein n=1 Tax=Polyrhizophydium stewartii TaxID=2732419 RepID=A0ABR4MVN5_9FUNG|nr:hypothetical protein HK105_002487 [Polyrhizophydium stewartii]